jgi:hypothetical protein
MTHDIVTVGNALIDAFMTIEKNSQYVRIGRHVVCFKYGQKIHVEQTSFLWAAMPAMWGWPFSRTQTGFVAEIGDDFLKNPQFIAKTLDLTHLLITKNAASSLPSG